MVAVPKLWIIISVILFVWFEGCEAVYKKWIRNTAFSNPDNWQGGHVPCDKDHVTLPESSPPIVIQTNASFMELVLPTNGEVILGNSVSISGATSGSNVNCAGQVATFTRTNALHWMDPSNWCLIDDPEDPCLDPQPSLLDTERIPCSTDSVIFPPDQSFFVDIRSDSPINIGALKIGSKQYTTESFQQLLQGGDKKNWFKAHSHSSMRVSGSGCIDITGCVCGNTNPLIEKKICGLHNHKCPELPCPKPLLPVGNCCPVCGALLTLKYGLSFRLTTLIAMVKQVRMSKKNERIASTVSKISDDTIQISVFDTDGGVESVLMARELKQILTDDSNNANKYRVTDIALEYDDKNSPSPTAGARTGGRSMNTSSIIGIVLAVVLVLALVVFAMFCLVDRNRCRPGLKMPTFRRRGMSQIELTPSVPFNDDILKDAHAGFDNPMYATRAEQGGHMTGLPSPANNNDAIVLDPSGVTFVNGHGEKGFTNPMYNEPQAASGSTGSSELFRSPSEGSDGLPSSPVATVHGDLPSPDPATDNRAFVNPLFNRPEPETLGPAFMNSSLRLNPVFSDDVDDSVI